MYILLSSQYLLLVRYYGFQQPHGLTFDEGIYAGVLARQLQEDPTNYSTLLRDLFFQFEDNNRQRRIEDIIFKTKTEAEKHYQNVLELAQDFVRVFPDVMTGKYLRKHPNAFDGQLIQTQKQNSVSSPVTTSNNRIGTNTTGGINFNPDYLDIQTQGNGLNVSSSLNMEAMENIEINGLVPVIFNITPVPSLQLLLGSIDQDEPFNSAQGEPFNDLSLLDPINRIERFRVEELESVSL